MIEAARRIRAPFGILLPLVLGIAGCASSPPARYYDLVAEPAAAIEKSQDRLVGIGPFAMPDYLKRPQIVVRDGGNALTLSEFDRWVEAPDQAFARWLSGLTDAKLASAVVVSYPFPADLPAEVQIRGSVRRWDVDATGRAVLVVQWGAIDGDGGTRVPLRTSRFAAEGIDTTDYDAIVTGMRVTLDAFADEIAQRIGSALLPSGTPGR
jgi:uncharacterized lipoprotein YmbA